MSIMAWCRGSSLVQTAPSGVYHRHVKRCQQQPGDDRGQEQVSDGDVGREAVNDEDDRWGDHRPQGLVADDWQDGTFPFDAIHDLLAIGHEQTRIGLKPASGLRSLLELAAKNGDREWNKSRQLVGVKAELHEAGQVP